MDLVPIIEGILFLMGDEGISLEELKNILDQEEDNIKIAIDTLKEQYNSPNHGLKVDYLGNKYKFTTKKEHKEYYEKIVSEEVSSTLSEASLEVLAIIAYNQPVTRIMVDEIRGINSSHLIRKLLLKNLIKEVGRSDAPGRPYLYSVTDEFLDYFGLKTIDELPEVKEVEENDEEKNLFDSKYKETL